MPGSRYCWDAGVFAALLSGERRAAGEVEGMLEVADSADRGVATIITCSAAIAEVIGESASTEIPQLFDALFRRPNFVMVNPSPAVYERARQLRIAAREEEGRSIKTPDALFVAIAILQRCDALHTFDDKLLRLSGRALVDGLIVCKPSGDQTVLSL